MTKKEKIEHNAKELFWKHGFKKVSIEEICKKSHVSRKTFYTYYENKNALIFFILMELMEFSIAQYQEIINEDIAFVDKIEKALTLKYNMSKSFSKEFLEDFYAIDSPEMLMYFKQETDKSMALTRQLFEQSQQSGQISSEINIEFIMWLLNKYQEIMNSKEIIEMFPTVEELTKQISAAFVYGMMRK